MPNPELLRTLLEGVSRSFYQTLRILPSAVRPQISLAYLLARTSDTIADSAAAPAQQRLQALDAFRGRLEYTGTALDLKALVNERNPKAENILLQRVNEMFEVLESFSLRDQVQIQKVLLTITSGQKLDLERFAAATPGRIIALETEADFEDYTYRVAGCVGEFWTRLCHTHLAGFGKVLEGPQLAQAVDFGKGLQRINILRDLATDLRQGRCYLPLSLLQSVGLEPSDLLDSKAITRLRPVYEALINRTEEYLARGWAYTTGLPRNFYRLRLACAWPILIGAKTLALLRVGNPLDAWCRLKISRNQFRGLVLQSIVNLPFPRKWNGLHARISSEIPPQSGSAADASLGQNSK